MKEQSGTKYWFLAPGFFWLYLCVCYEVNGLKAHWKSMSHHSKRLVKLLDRMPNPRPWRSPLTISYSPSHSLYKWGQASADYAEESQRKAQKVICALPHVVVGFQGSGVGESVLFVPCALLPAGSSDKLCLPLRECYLNSKQFTSL